MHKRQNVEHAEGDERGGAIHGRHHAPGARPLSKGARGAIFL
jgi:hypothetical protein